MQNNEDGERSAAVPNDWASNPLGQDPPETLQTFQRDLKVGLMATNRSALRTCGIDEELSAVVERYRNCDFDFLPVTEQKDIEAGAVSRIIGLIEIAPFMNGQPIEGDVRTHMRHLSEENLIGADASILSFIRNADRQKCRLVISGQDISGLVNLSDLQRLPVRAALFGLVTYLEILMADAIRREVGGTEGWLERLSEGRRKGIKTEIKKAHKDDSFVDALLFTQFADKIEIISRSPRFGVSKSDFENELERAVHLRNRLAHANDYAKTANAALDICVTVRIIEKWNGFLSQWLRADI